MSSADTSARASYARTFARSVTGIRDLECPPRVAETIFDELSREEERTSEQRDPLGRWEHECSAAFRAGRPTAPSLEELLAGVRADFLRSHPHFAPEPTWPGNRRFAVCLTHDVDFVSTRDHLRKGLRRLHRALTARGPRREALRGAAGSLVRAVTEPFSPDRYGRYEDWLTLEARHGFRSTFFFIAPPDPAHVLDCDYALSDPVTYQGTRMPVSAMMKRIHEAGWEIGLHGSIESARLPGALARQKRLIEDALGAPIRSTRQHYLQYDVTVTPGLQSGAEFLCDSTVGFNRSVGFRASTSFPYLCWDHQGQRDLPLLEVPLHVMDSAIFKHLGAASTAEALAICLPVMDAVERVGGCLGLNWHPNAIADPRAMETYRTLLAEAERRGAWGCSAGQVHDWWTERLARITPR